jgi:L-methionine (R)-S-oxide reductase
MPHAESSLVPPEITTKPAFYAHIHAQLDALLEDYWLSNLAQVASLLYHSYAGCALYGLSEDSLPVVNWAGFYITEAAGQALLRLGPYHGRPACTLIKAQAGRGVCADAFVEKRGVVVDDVEAYPGHIGQSEAQSGSVPNTAQLYET